MNRRKPVRTSGLATVQVRPGIDASTSIALGAAHELRVCWAFGPARQLAVMSPVAARVAIRKLLGASPSNSIAAAIVGSAIGIFVLMSIRKRLVVNSMSPPAVHADDSLAQLHYRLEPSCRLTSSVINDFPRVVDARPSRFAKVRSKAHIIRIEAS